MALLINKAHILYYHMDAIQSIMLGCSYIANPDYLVIMISMSTVFQHLDIAIITGPNV